jgi:prophage regulatory protein
MSSVTSSAPPPGARLLTPRELKTLKGIKFSKVWLRRLSRTGKFPQPIKIGRQTAAYLESEIDDWIRQRAAERYA